MVCDFIEVHGLETHQQRRKHDKKSQQPSEEQLEQERVAGRNLAERLKWRGFI